MKSLIITVLLFALLAAAFFTRPSKADFKRYIVTQAAAGNKNVIAQAWDKWQAESFADGVDFNDRLLWVDVQKNGTTVYSGAFSHWFNRAIFNAEMATVKQKAGEAGATLNRGLEEVKKH